MPEIITFSNPFNPNKNRFIFATPSTTRSKSSETRENNSMSKTLKSSVVKKINN